MTWKIVWLSKLMKMQDGAKFNAEFKILIIQLIEHKMKMLSVDSLFSSSILCLVYNYA